MEKNQENTNNYTKEYNDIMDSSDKSVIVKTEWTKEGDYFQKLSMYDDSYQPVKTLGNTTLIKAL